MNVAAEHADARSVLNLYRQLTDLRRKEGALSIVSYQAVKAEGNLLVYLRSYKNQQFLVVMNLGPCPLSFHHEPRFSGNVVLSTFLDKRNTLAESGIHLRGDEALIIQLESIRSNKANELR